MTEAELKRLANFVCSVDERIDHTQIWLSDLHTLVLKMLSENEKHKELVRDSRHQMASVKEWVSKRKLERQKYREEMELD